MENGMLSLRFGCVWFAAFFFTINTCVETATDLGCFEGDTGILIESVQQDIPESNLTPTKCIESCEIGKEQTPYAGLTDGNKCYCINRIPTIQSRILSRGCNTACSGSGSETCGGRKRIKIFRINSVPLSNRYITSWTYVGCYARSLWNTNKTLFNGFTVDVNKLSPDNCHRKCYEEGSLYFALRSDSCVCGDRPIRFKYEVSTGLCPVACLGDREILCRSYGFSLYATGISDSPIIQSHFVGCYNEQFSARLISGYEMNLRNTNAPRRCVNICMQHGYHYAAVRNQFCSCNNNIPKETAMETYSDCMQNICPGDETETCGGVDRLKVFSTNFTFSGIPSGSYIGCFRESSKEQNVSHTCLLNEYSKWYPRLTPELCHKICFRESQLYFGLSRGGMCYCGDATLDGDLFANDTECGMSCEGDANYECGGILRTAIFSTGILNMPTLDRYVGCYQDDGSDVVLPEMKVELSRTNSPRRCLNLCTVLGFSYAGVHQERFCQCGKTKPSVTLVREAASCAVYKCSGDPVESCGGPDGIMKVFRTQLSDQNRVPGYIGCYKNQSVNRLLPDTKELSSQGNNDTDRCIFQCNKTGFAFAGLSRGTECYCGYYSPSLISKAKENECSSSCSGNKKESCGGNEHLSVYYTGARTEDIDARVYLGCFKEDSAGRTDVIFEKRLLSGFWMTMNATIEKCHFACHKEGFLYFGLTEKVYCFCGDNEPRTKVKESECFHTCTGNVNQRCGAESRFSVYHTGITDFDTVGKYLGCYKDSTGMQVLRGRLLHLPATNSPKRCSNICASKGFTYFGLRIGMECRCGHDNPSNSKLATNSSDCDNKKCPGNPNETCGSQTSIKIYQLKKPVLSLECDPRYDDCNSAHRNIVTEYPIIEELTSEAPPTVTATEVAVYSCTFPSPSAGRTCSVNCNGATDCSKSVSPIPAYAVLTCSCGTGYALSTNSNKAYCINSAWIPDLPECVRLCPALQSASLKFLSCTHKGDDVPCDNSAKPDTKIYIDCKPTYKPEDPSLVFMFVTCLSDGNWNRPLYRCRPGCGESAVSTIPLLTEGNVTKPNDMPWHVAIYRKKNPTTGKEHQYICGGTIMSPALIISAAHCFYDRMTNKHLPAEEYEIAVAKYTADYNKMDDPLTKVFNITKINIPDDFYGEENYYVADIALLEVENTIVMGSRLMPICIDLSTVRSKPPEKGMVAGWGLTENDKPSDVLLVAELPFVPRDECRSMVPQHFRTYVSQPDKFCAGSVSGAGTKQGDSGGGWMYKKDGHYFIYGIVSFKGHNNSSLALFTRISSHLPWMEEIRNKILSTRGL